ncbi:HNH endonuclease signature motif containing protein [uncultured Microbacterium sp.]|uniref:HNH endonuclease n=1 Tax=uncultured Microbacterium sp. TaxID=191216 RepID=A0A1Y5P8A6_9MICO|nr:HNH endonuclease signature motif containing protein [uncultured Microbacterium sp.]SBS74936.1 HNH endonuclease [uncultured Microbacterium sp.]
MQELPDPIAEDAAARAAGRLAEVLPDLIDVREEIARLQAREARLLAVADEIVDDWVTDAGWRHRSEAELPHRVAAAEIAAVWRVSDRTVQRQLDDARSLVHDFPATLASLETGRISLAHARVILASGSLIARPELRAEYEESVLPYAEAESATRLAPLARRRAEWYAETTFEERHRAARLHRRVSVTDLDDGMAEFLAVGPAPIIHAAFDRVTQLAHGVQEARDTAGDEGAAADTRTLDELRADVFADLILTADPLSVPLPTGAAAVQGRVQVTVPVLALIGDDIADPFEATMLDGHGPVDLATARALAASAPGWDRILTHPVTGAVLAVDRYRPSEEMRRHLKVRDQHCRFPGCRLPVTACDIDHTHDRARGGATDAANLAHLCRRHHTVKHNSAWRVRQRPGGVLEWTSPTGRVYDDRPVSTVTFVTDPEFDLAPF